MFCIECGQELNSDSEFCFKCGAKAAISTDESGGFCIQCGKKLPEDATFCIDCGAKVTAEENTAEGENFCTQCGQKLSGDSEFCFACGAKTAPEPVVANVAKQATAETPPPAPSPSPDVAEMYSIVDHAALEVRQAPTPLKSDAVEAIPVPKAEPQWAQEPQLLQEEPPQQASTNASELGKQRKLLMTLFCVSAALLVAVVGLVVFILIGQSGNEDDDMYANGQISGDGLSIDREAFDEAGDYYVHVVETGYLPDHPGIPVGTAFDEFFVNPSWTHHDEEHADGRVVNYVSVHGYIFHEGEYVMGHIIFQLSHDGTTFHPINLIIDGLWQDVMLLYEIIDEIMESAGR